MGVLRMQPKGGESSDQGHRLPRHPSQRGDGKPQARLGEEAGERVQHHELGHEIGMRERKAQRDGASERLADESDAPSGRRDDTNDARQVGDLRVHVRSVIAQRIGRDSIPSGEHRHLAVEEAPRPIHAGYQHEGRAVACHGDLGIVGSRHGRAIA